MSFTLLAETKTVLSELTALQASITKRLVKLNKFEEYSLSPSTKHGRSMRYFYLKRKGVKGRKYLGTDKNKYVNAIKEYKFLSKQLEIIDNDIDLLKAVDQSYILPSHNAINSRLPKVYQSKTAPLLMSTSPSAEEWKRKKIEEKARYEPFRPENLIHTAHDGTKMRSLSEVHIANYLISLGITYVYELPLDDHGKRIWPDFTILSPVDNKTVIIIEHQGAMGDPTYHAKFIKSLNFYLQTRLVPNKDVFFTFNHLDGHLDLRQIDRILYMAFGYRAKSMDRKQTAA